MSTTAVLDRPREVDDADWLVLDDPAEPHRRIVTTGRGVERRGIVGRGRAQRPPRTLIALPSVDELTS